MLVSPLGYLTNRPLSPSNAIILHSLPSTSPTTQRGSASSVTTLPSGLTVVTENAALTTTVALTYPNAGSSNEGSAEAGAAIANRYLSFRSGSGLSSALIVRSLEDVGASVFSSAGRRGATVGYTALKENAAFVSPLLVTECSFEKWDVKEAQEMAGVEAADATSNAQVCEYSFISGCDFYYSTCTNTSYAHVDEIIL